MHFLSPLLEDYIANNSENEPEILQALTKETHLKVLRPRMLTGHFQGRVLSMFAKLINPQSILEIGTYTGYSALCLAEGLSKNGVLHTIDYNEELQPIQDKYFKRSAYGSQIKRHFGDALEIIPTLNTTFDLIFIDADKSQYPKYFELVMKLVKPGSVILSDNVLWSGKVVEPLAPKDSTTKIVLEYNKMLQEDPRIVTVLLPIRDGLTMSRVL